MNSTHPLIQAFRGVVFPAGTASKRFAQDMIGRSPEAELSEKAEAFAWRIAWTYRRQLPADLALEAQRRKVHHKLAYNPIGSSLPFRCEACGDHMDKRQINAPCRGPAEPVKKSPSRIRPGRRTGTSNFALRNAKQQTISALGEN